EGNISVGLVSLVTRWDIKHTQPSWRHQGPLFGKLGGFYRQFD
ncbi:unnamed protein product, partial [Linum tenue]